MCLRPQVRQGALSPNPSPGTEAGCLPCSSHKRFPSTGSCAEAGGSSSLQNSPIRSLPHWNSQSSMPSTPDLRVRSPHYVHSTR